MAALDKVRQLELHIVAEIVEAEFVVRAVSDVGGIGGLPLCISEFVLHDTDRHAEESVDSSHPLGVSPGQVVDNGDDVYALSGDRVQIGGQRRDQRFAFTRFHFGDLAVVKDHAADKLDIEVAHVQDAPASLAHDSESVWQ